jgi:hypothetical protein
MNEVEQPEFNYEIDYAHSYFRTEIPIAICPHCGVVDGVFERTSTDGMGGGYGTALFSHEHPLVFLILEEEDRHLAGPRSYYIDGEPPANILKLLKKAGWLWKSGWGCVAVEKQLKKILGGEEI